MAGSSLRRLTSALLPLAVAVSLVSGCALPGAPVSSGISGRVYVGPLAPGRHTLPGEDGDEQPYAAQLLVRSVANDSVVATVSSDPHGEFSVPLPPGMYHVDPQTMQAPFPRARRATVQVAAGRFSDVLILYDTWIR